MRLLIRQKLDFHSGMLNKNGQPQTAIYNGYLLNCVGKSLEYCSLNDQLQLTLMEDGKDRDTNYHSSSLSNSNAWYLRAFLFGFASDAPLGGRGAVGFSVGSTDDFLLFCSNSSAVRALISSCALVSTTDAEVVALAAADFEPARVA